MIQCFGIAALAEEIKQAIQDLLQGRMEGADNTYGVLMGAIVQLSDYIDALSVGFDDCVLVLQPVINEIRLVRGRAVIVEEDLFVAQMHALGASIPIPSSPGRAPGAAETAARKLMPVYQASLLQWLKGTDATASLSRIGKISEQLSAVAVESSVYELWRAAAACVEALLTRTLDDSFEIKRLFGRAGQQIKLLGTSGESPAAAQMGDLVYQLLFFVGRSRGRGQRIISLRELFRLETFLPTSETLEELRRRLRGPNTQLLNRVADEIRADLVNVKDAIDLAVRAGGRTAADLSGTLAKLRRISNTLSVLGLEMLQRVVLSQARALEGLPAGEPIPPQFWMDFATATLRVEHSLESALFRQLGRRGASAPLELDEAVPHDRDLRDSVDALRRESLVNFAKVKANIDAFVRSGDEAGLSDSARLLAEIAAGFRVIEAQRAADAVTQLLDFLQSANFPALRDDAVQAGHFADAIAAIEYLIESQRAGMVPPEQWLGSIERSIAQLLRLGAAVAVQAAADDAAPAAPEQGGFLPELPELPVAAAIGAETAVEPDPEIREVFLDEATEVLQALQTQLPRWARAPDDRPSLMDIRRAFHTLKGSGRMVGASLIGDFALAIETMLNRCLDGSIAVDADVADIVREAVQQLPGLIESFRSRSGQESGPIMALAERANLAASGREEHGDDDLAAVFRSDAGERLDAVESWLASRERAGPDAEVPDEVVRAFHTLRGSGHVVNASNVGDLAGALETYLDSVRGARLLLPREALQLIGEAVQILRGWVDQVGRAAPENADLRPWLHRIETVQSVVPETAVQAAADRQLAEVFANEALDLLQKVEQDIEAWSRSPEALYQVRTLRSSLHTLHGAALMSACPPIAAAAQALYQRLESLLDGPWPRPGFFSALLNVVEGFYQMLDRYRDGALTELPAVLITGIDQLDPYLEKEKASAALRSEPAPAEPEPPAALSPEPGAASSQAPVPEPAPAAEVQQQEPDYELQEIFLAEAAELMEGIDRYSVALERDPQDMRAATELRRTFHTMKGSARMARFEGVGAVAHQLELLLSSVLRDNRPVDAGFLAQLYNGTEGLLRLLDEVRGGSGVDITTMLSDLEAPGSRLASPPQDEPVVEETIELSGGTLDDETPASFVEARTAELSLAAEPMGMLQPAFDSPAAFAELAEEAPSIELSGGLIEVDESAAPVFAEQFFEPAAVVIATDNQAFDNALFEQSLFGSDAGEEASERSSHPQPSLPGEAPGGVPEFGSQSGSWFDVAPVDAPQAFSDGSGQASWAPQPAMPESPPQIEFSQDFADTKSSAIDGMQESWQSPESEAAAFDPELADIFAAEAAELLEALDAGLSTWRDNRHDSEALREIQRLLHTLKGGARMAGLAAMGSAAHEMESVVNAMEQGRVAADPAGFAGLQLELDALHRMHDALMRGEFATLLPRAMPDDASASPSGSGGSDHRMEAVPKPAAESIPAQGPVFTIFDTANSPLPSGEGFEPASAGGIDPFPTDADAASPGGWDPELFWKPDDDQLGLALARRETARVPVEKLDSMLNEAGEISIFRSRLEEQNVTLQASLKEMVQTIVRLREQLRLMDIETEAQINARGLNRGAEDDRYEAEFDPLEMDRYSRMQELSRALAESVGDLSSLHVGMDQVVGDAETLLQQQARINTSVQTGLMSTLMVPFSRQVQRLQRVVRQAAADNGRQAEAVFSGIESELDRNVLERMTAPLEHLLRNAVVHGIEPPDLRLGQGKPAVGTIQVTLRREGSQLVIELVDDGRGLDYRAIRETAIKRGLMPPEADLRNEEIAQFIFAPGFSTARQLTQDAGRGIGMDVVASEVKQLGGSLELASETGRGTRFMIRLPLTLSVSQSLLVSVGDEMFAVPLTSVEGIARIPVGQLADYYADEGAPLSYGGHAYRVAYLGDFIGVPRQISEDAKTQPAILVRVGEGLTVGERRLAVVINRLHGNREIVSKAVGPQVSSVSGVGSATILSDGRVMLILDIPALAQDRARRELAAQVQVAHAPSAERTDTASMQAVDSRATVMVVDDSITMRRVAERLLVRAGYRVVTAKDGLDAMAQLQTEDPAVILLDIEMPRADGFEVAAFVRNTGRIAQVPIIMITSRSGEKHRERARRLGVNRYLIKPYQEDQLMSEVRSVLSDATVEV